MRTAGKYLVADLHLHSKYAYATSPRMDLEGMSRWAKIKGVGLLATGDLSHPLWFKELKTRLKESGNGTYAYNGVRFLLNVELSCIYRRNGRIYKIHHLVFLPGIEAAAELGRRLARYGKLSSDGRPILRLDSRDLLEIVREVSPDAMLIPAHAWTPHFGVFGSRSGFDSLDECFGDAAREISAIETGLSSDPAMNWRLSALDGITLISNSDAHSPENIGREANVFCTGGTDDLYYEVKDILEKKDRSRFLYTVEFFPEEGKYHYDGCRACGERMTPAQTKKHRGRCPSCGKKATVGVLHRIEELADRPEGYRPAKAIPFRKAVPLRQVIAEALGTRPQSAKVEKTYLEMAERFGGEFKVLLDVPAAELAAAYPGRVSEGILRMREGKVEIAPGYDGVYGTVKITF